MANKLLLVYDAQNDFLRSVRWFENILICPTCWLTACLKMKPSHPKAVTQLPLYPAFSTFHHVQTPLKLGLMQFSTQPLLVLTVGARGRWMRTTVGSGSFSRASNEWIKSDTDWVIWTPTCIGGFKRILSFKCDRFARLLIYTIIHLLAKKCIFNIKSMSRELLEKPM